MNQNQSDANDQSNKSDDADELSFFDNIQVSDYLEIDKNKESSYLISPDFDNTQQQAPCKNKKTKFRSIYTKNMQVKLPSLKWLPGEVACLRGNDNDDAIVSKFKESVEYFKIVSIMIFAEEDTKYDIAAITFSTPLLTIFIHISLMLSKKNIIIPNEILQIISKPDLTIVTPGKLDWHYSLQKDHFMVLNDKKGVKINFSGHEVNLVDYREKLNICNTGKEVCEHIKMIYWLFQFKIDSQLHGNKVPQNPTSNWKTLIDHYGKLLIYEYWALEEKLRKYNENSKNGVDTSPIYLEDLLIRHKIVTNMSKEELRKKLLGGRNYPNPPLPNLPG